MVGTVVEIYDFVIYTFVAATVFGPLFFPAAAPWVGTLAALLVGYTILSAIYGERLGRNRMVFVAGLLTALWAFPALWLVKTGTPALAWLSAAVGCIAYGIMNGVMPSLMTEYFPARLRYTGVALAFAFGNVIGGALLPLPALSLVGRLDGSTLPLSLALVFGGLATMAGALLLRRLKRFGRSDRPLQVVAAGAGRS